MAPRIRTIKPEIWGDETLGTVPIGARLLYIGLITQADDEGRFRAAPALVRSQVFPYDESLSTRRVSEWLAALGDAGRIRLYTVNEEAYGSFPSWEKHQKIDRPSPSKLPPEPAALGDSTSVRRGLDAGSGREGIKDQDQDHHRAPARGKQDDEFDQIWQEWSTHQVLIQHRKAHRDMRKAARTALGDYELSEIQTAISLYATCLASTEHYFSHRWTLAEFLQRGVGKFVPEAEPLARYLEHRDQKSPGTLVRLDPAAARDRQVERCRREYELRAAELGPVVAREDVLGMFSDEIVHQALEVPA